MNAVPDARQMGFDARLFAAIADGWVGAAYCFFQFVVSTIVTFVFAESVSVAGWVRLLLYIISGFQVGTGVLSPGERPIR